MFYVSKAGLGLGATETHNDDEGASIGRKGISNERTFAPISRKVDLYSKLEQVAQILEKHMV